MRVGKWGILHHLALGKLNSMGSWCTELSDYMGGWCRRKLNSMGGWCRRKLNSMGGWVKKKCLLPPPPPPPPQMFFSGIALITPGEKAIITIQNHCDKCFKVVSIHICKMNRFYSKCMIIRDYHIFGTLFATITQSLQMR